MIEQFEPIPEGEIAQILAPLEELPYHNRDHIAGVRAAIKQLARLSGISGKMLNLMDIAVLFHEVGIPQGRENHEKKGTEIAVNYLRKHGFSPEDIDIVNRFILVTKGEPEGDRPFVTHPKDIYEKIICDADLAILGADEYTFSKANNALQKELGETDRKSWIGKQISFLKGHNYHTEKAIKLWDAGKAKNLERLQHLYGML